jgi:hypothetical protein
MDTVTADAELWCSDSAVTPETIVPAIVAPDPALLAGEGCAPAAETDGAAGEFWLFPHATTDTSTANAVPAQTLRRVLFIRDLQLPWGGKREATVHDLYRMIFWISARIARALLGVDSR